MSLLMRISYLVKRIRRRRTPVASRVISDASPTGREPACFHGLAWAGTLHVLLGLASAVTLQIPVFADGNSNHITLAPLSANPKSELPSANEILTQARAHLPKKAFRIKGQILSGGRRGKLEHTGYIEMFLDFGDDPAIVRYKINDAFGTPLEQMTISMAEGCDPEFKYKSVKPRQPAAEPKPTGSIMDTDITWNDLGLLFLWRSDGKTQYKEKLRGRDCYVIVFPLNGNGMQIVWIDMQMLVLIQMEELDANGRLLRRMTVKSIKKISDQWMIKNLEIRAYPSRHHTLIKIDEVLTLK